MPIITLTLYRHGYSIYNDERYKVYELVILLVPSVLQLNTHGYNKLKVSRLLI